MKPLSIVLFAAVLCCTSSTALATESTMILGLHTVDGDDEFANSLSAALREHAADIDAWQVSAREVSLSQMGLAYGCEEYDNECLTAISEGLKAAKIVYGVIRRTSAFDEYDYRVTLNLFDADLGSIENSITDVFPSTIDLDSEAFSAKASRLIKKLAGVHEPIGTIVVTSNKKDAEVRLDDVPIGQTKNGELLIENVAPGTHEIEVIKEGFLPYRESGDVVEDQTTYIRSTLGRSGEDKEGSVPLDELPESDSGDSLDWLGWTLVGTSGVLLGGAIVSWVWLDSIDNDPTFQEYREIVGNRKPDAEDVCDEVNRYIYAPSETSGTPEERAKQEDVQVMCYRADVLEVLQYVFIGTAVITAGFGTYILIAGSDSSSDEAKRDQASPIVLRPTVGRRSAYISATLSF